MRKKEKKKKKKQVVALILNANVVVAKMRLAKYETLPCSKETLHSQIKIFLFFLIELAVNTRNVNSSHNIPVHLSMDL